MYYSYFCAILVFVLFYFVGRQFSQFHKAYFFVIAIFHGSILFDQVSRQREANERRDHHRLHDDDDDDGQIRQPLPFPGIEMTTVQIKGTRSRSINFSFLKQQNFVVLFLTIRRRRRTPDVDSHRAGSVRKKSLRTTTKRPTSAFQFFL